MEKREKQFNCMMSEQDYEKLTWIAKYEGMSRGLVIRLAIFKVYRVMHDHVNMCADGHQCLCRGKRVFSEKPEEVEMEVVPEEQKMMLGGE